MSDETRLLNGLRRLRRAALVDNAIGWGLRALLGAGLCIGALVVVARWVPVVRDIRLGLMATVLTVLGALTGWVLTRPSLDAVARSADAHLQLRERLASAFELRRGGGPMLTALLADAARSADRLQTRDAYPLRRHRIAGLLAAGSFLLAGATLAIPRSTAVASPRPDPGDAAVRKAIGTLRVQADGVHDAAGRTPQDATLQQLDHQLQSALSQLQGSTAPRALETLSALGDQLSRLQDRAVAQSVSALGAAADPLASTPETLPIARDLARGDLKAAAADLATLGANLPQLSPSQRKAVQLALQGASTASQADPQLSQQLAKSAKGLEHNDIEQSRQGLEGAGSRVGDVSGQKAAQQRVGAAAAAVESAREQAATGANSDGKGGDAPSASGKPTTGSVGSGPSSAKDGNTRPGSAPGVAGPGEAGNGGAGSGGGQGSASGEGSGNGPGGGGSSGSTAASGTDRVFVGGAQGQARPDDSTAPQLGAGAAVPLSDLGTVVAQFERSALLALERSVVSPGDRDLVRSYFSDLGGGR